MLVTVSDILEDCKVLDVIAILYLISTLRLPGVCEVKRTREASRTACSKDTTPEEDDVNDS